MSYEKVSSINEKKRTITIASNNVRPLYYYTCKYNDGITLDDFRASVMIDILIGDFRLNNCNHKYNIIANKIENTNEYKELHDKIWNFNHHYTDEWVKEHYEENKNKLKELILKTFDEPLDKNKYVITNGFYYIKRINHYSYSYTLNSDRAKIYASKEIAQSKLYCLDENWVVEVL